MVDQDRKGALTSNISPAVFVAAMLVAVVAGVAGAKSLYVINSITDSSIQAYDIAADGTLTFQTETVPLHMVGAVGLAVDPNSQYLFITYESWNMIKVLQAATMRDAGTVFAPGASNLAGIVFSYSEGLLYCVDRYTQKLYVYTWDPDTVTLTPVDGSPFTLAGATAYGIALDEIHGLLYVANGTRTINVYRTTDWSLQNTILLDRRVVSVAVDVEDGLLYAGGGYGWDNFYLTQYHVSTRTQREVQVEPDAGVFGLAVDPASGLVYVTTGNNNMEGGDNLLVYDRSLRQIDSIPNIGDATGVAIPGIDIGYNPLNLSKNVVGGIVDEPDGGTTKYVRIGDTVTYAICFDARTYGPNTVSVVDVLPRELSFARADGDGLFGHYDPTTHTYTWSNPPLTVGAPTCLELVAWVNRGTPLGTVITNRAAIDTDKTPPITTSVKVTAKEAGGPLGLGKSIVGVFPDPNGGAEVAYVNAGDTIIYAVCLDNSGRGQAVKNVSVIDKLSRKVSFVSADGDGVSGQYDAATHTYTWFYPSLAAGSSVCLKLVVQVGGDVAPGTAITNSVYLGSDSTAPSSASVEAIVKKVIRNPLHVSKSILGGFAEPNGDSEVTSVNAGDTVTYAIHFDNNTNDQPVTNVSVIDILPEEASFVAADGNGVFGQYDPATHTYTWFYQSIPAGSSACLRLLLRVNEATPPGTTITNSTVIDSDQVQSTTTSVDAVVKEVLYDPLNLNKGILGSAAEPNTGGGVAHVNAGDTVVYAIYFDNTDNDKAVTNVSLIDVIPQDVNFVAAEGKGGFGKYDAAAHTCTWTYPSVPAGSSACVTLVVQVNQDAVPGTIITNYAIIDSDQMEGTLATVDVVVIEALRDPLSLSKSVVGPADENAGGEVTYVSAGDTVTYSVCFGNNNNQAVSNVSIIDRLAQKVSFVSAEGDGTLGQYDARTHTYRWFYPSMPAGTNLCLKLTVRVDEDTAPSTKITNSAIIDSNEVPSTTASVDVVVYTPVKAELCIVPWSINPRTGFRKIAATVRLPAGIKRSDLDGGPLVLYPGAIKSTGQHIFFWRGRVRIVAYFNQSDLVNAVGTGGIKRLKVVGKLKSGWPFYGEGTVRIAK